MDRDGFLADLERKPEALAHLATELEDGDLLPSLPGDLTRVVLLGMGSSRFAALPVAQRLRAEGVDAVAEFASVERIHPGGDDTLVVGISASGGTEETVELLRRQSGRSHTLAVTNTSGAPIADAADTVVPMLAGEEVGGVASRTFQHTLALLLALEGVLTGRDLPVASWCRAAAEASADLLDRRERWLPEVREVLEEDVRTWFIAPAERRSSCEQSALMIREGPRRQADACESGDWLHVDVYLTKPLPYRAVLHVGSRFDGAIADWMRRRGRRYVAIGGDVDGAAATVRYRHDDDPVVALLTEVLVAELLAAAWWDG